MSKLPGMWIWPIQLPSTGSIMVDGPTKSSLRLEVESLYTPDSSFMEDRSLFIVERFREEGIQYSVC